MSDFNRATRLYSRQAEAYKERFTSFLQDVYPYLIADRDGDRAAGRAVACAESHELGCG